MSRKKIILKIKDDISQKVEPILKSLWHFQTQDQENT